MKIEGEMIRVLVVDDSAFVRDVLKTKLSEFPDIEVVGTAQDPYVAKDLIPKLNPDVMTLDVEMPKMDGVTFLRKLMPQFPVRTIIVSSLTPRGGEVTIAALEAGAIDFVTKPGSDLARQLPQLMQELSTKIRMASKCQLIKPSPKRTTPIANQAVNKVLKGSTDKLIAIGASTGGTEATRLVLEGLPMGMPGIVVTQHMPKGFTKAYAERLNSLFPFEVKEAEHDDRVIPGRVLIAPGETQMTVHRYGGQYRVAIGPGEKYNNHAPSVGRLFDSVADYVGSNAIGVMLTGMGKDGSLEMKTMKDKGAYNIVQDEKSSVVWGMPGEAFKADAHHELLPLDKIGAAIGKAVSRLN